MVDRLLADGWEVFCWDDLSNGDLDNLGGTDCQIIDVADRELVRALMVDGCDCVFHLAARGSVPYSIAHPEVTFDSNVLGTHNVLHAAVDAGAKRVVYASSASYYGDGDGMASEFGPSPKFESMPPAPLNHYAASKVFGEHWGRIFHELHGLNFTALRFFNVFGPRQRADSDYAAVVPKFIDRAIRGEPLELHGGGVQTRDLTYVDNVVDALVAVAEAVPEKVAGQAFNVCAGERVSIKDLASEISLYVFGGYSDELDGSVAELKLRAVPPRPGDIRDSFGDSTKLNMVTGWVPRVDWRDGVRRTVEWHKR